MSIKKSALVSIKTLLSRDPCAHAKVAIDMIDVMLVEHPAQHEVDWEKLYRLEVKKKEALAAKYERDTGKKLTRIVPMAEQPAQQDGPVNEGWQLTVANGHSGYGVYAHMEDYPEEGAVLVQSIEQPAQQEPVALDRLYIEALIEGLYQNEDPVSIDAAEEFQRLLGTHTSPPASKPEDK